MSFIPKFKKTVKEEGYLPKQAFNFDWAVIHRLLTSVLYIDCAAICTAVVVALCSGR
jgi:hypothetical protein